MASATSLSSAVGFSAVGATSSASLCCRAPPSVFKILAMKSAKTAEQGGQLCAGVPGQSSPAFPWVYWCYRRRHPELATATLQAPAPTQQLSTTTRLPPRSPSPALDGQPPSGAARGLPLLPLPTATASPPPFIRPLWPSLPVFRPFLLRALRFGRRPRARGARRLRLSENTARTIRVSGNPGPWRLAEFLPLKVKRRNGTVFQYSLQKRQNKVHRRLRVSLSEDRSDFSVSPKEHERKLCARSEWQRDSF